MRGTLAPTKRTLDLALDGPLCQEPNREQVVASTDDSSVIDIDNIKQTFSKEPLQPHPMCVRVAVQQLGQGACTYGKREGSKKVLFCYSVCGWRLDEQ